MEDVKKLLRRDRSSHNNSIITWLQKVEVKLNLSSQQQPFRARVDTCEIKAY